jgi:hypothetical protein
VTAGQVPGQVLAGQGPADGVAVHVDDEGVAMEEQGPEVRVEEVVARPGQVPEDVDVVLRGQPQQLGIDAGRRVAGTVVFGVLVVERLGQDLARAQADGRDALVPERGVVRAAVVGPGLEAPGGLGVEPLLDDLVELGELGQAADEKIAVARADHVDVEVERGLVERHGRVFDVVARALEAQLLAGPGAEDDGPGRLEVGGAQGPGRLQDDPGRGRGGRGGRRRRWLQP